MLTVNGVYNQSSNAAPVKSAPTSMGQDQVATAAPAATYSKQNEFDKVDSIVKYKELLDMGIITQEEFDAKKKQLLNL